MYNIACTGWPLFQEIILCTHKHKGEFIDPCLSWLLLREREIWESVKGCKLLVLKVCFKSYKEVSYFFCTYE